MVNFTAQFLYFILIKTNSCMMNYKIKLHL